MTDSIYTFTEEQSRTVRVIGIDAQQKLANSHIAIFGVGGVGGHIAEALARAGIGAIDLFDRDTVSLSNINRQIVALHSTIGQDKVQVMKERILDISPACRVSTHKIFYLPENAGEFDLTTYDYIADAIDTVSAKIELAVRACSAHVPIISAMGAGNKLYPERFEVTDLFKTTTDPLARVMRRELKKRGVHKLTVVYSNEEPKTTHTKIDKNGKSVPGSLAFVPSVMGLIMAGEMIRQLTEIK